MPRLLILCEYPTLLGGERSMLATLPGVAAANFDVHVAGPDRGPLAAALRERGVSHLTWSPCDDAGEKRPLSQLRETLGELIRTTRPDLVHANSLSTARISGPVTRDCRVPSIGHLRDIVKLPRQAVDDVNAHRRILAVSRATRDYHVAQGIEAARCVVVHNGVDLNQFQPRPATGYLHRAIELPSQARLVAVIGQLGLRKATDVVLAAALQIAPDVRDVHWLIVGERTSNKDESRGFEELLHLIAEEPALAGRVHFLGSRGDVPQLLNECVLLIHAARQEPLARVLLEGAASGQAIVATDVGGTREIFPTEEDGGVLVPPDNRTALADAMLALLRDEPRRGALASASRLRAEKSFDIRQAAARLIEQYQSVLI